MYFMIGFVFFMTARQMDQAPSASFSFKNSFANEQECNSFLASEAGTAAKENLNRFIRVTMPEEKTFTISFKCLYQEDGSI